MAKPQPHVIYEIVHDGVRATIHREEQGCSIVLAHANQASPGWADNLELFGALPQVRQALGAAEAWLKEHPVTEKRKPAN